MFIKTNNVFVVVNQPPKIINKSEEAVEYDIQQCILHLKKYFGKTGTWYPKNPLIRKALHQHIGNSADIELAHQDWQGIAHMNDWRCPSHAL